MSKFPQQAGNSIRIIFAVIFIFLFVNKHAAMSTVPLSGTLRTYISVILCYFFLSEVARNIKVLRTFHSRYFKREIKISFCLHRSYFLSCILLSYIFSNICSALESTSLIFVENFLSTLLT